MKTPEEKYRNDSEYRRLVDMITHLIVEANFTPSEIREAGTLACIHYEMRHARKYYTIPLKVNAALSELKRFRESEEP